VSPGIDLERTMLIDGIAHRPDDAIAADVPLPPSIAARARLPKARAMMLRGPRSGNVIELDRVVATFGRAGRALAVVVRRPNGFFLSRVEGRRHPRVNGRPIDDEPLALANGDVIDVGDERLEFLLD
jgi:hypothetical protein